MRLSEAIEAATTIIDCYPNGGANTGNPYIGAIAAMLVGYPRQIAMRCAGKSGIVRECKFLPTPAEIVAWCEREAGPLYAKVESDLRAAEQFVERQDFERRETIERPRRLSVEELKIKFGDWTDDWRPYGQREREQREAAKAMLIDKIGQEVFEALPDQSSKTEYPKADFKLNFAVKATEEEKTKYAASPYLKAAIERWRKDAVS